MRKLNILAFTVFLLAGLQPVCAQVPYQSLFATDLNFNTSYPCGISADTPTAQMQTALKQTAFYGGGTVDMTCFQTPITLTTDVFSPISKHIMLVLPAHTVTISANVTIPVNFTLIYSNGSAIAAAPGFTITDNSLPYRSPNGFEFLDPGVASAPSLTPGTGGTLPLLGTYWYCVTSLPSTGGETQCSAEAHVTLTGSQDSVALTWASDADAASYKIYRGLASGAENVYYTSGTNSYTDTNATSTAGTPPAINSAWIPVGSGGGGSGTTVTVNGGGALAAANFNGTTPAPGVGYTNVSFQISGSSVSAEFPTGATPLQPAIPSQGTAFDYFGDSVAGDTTHCGAYATIGPNAYFATYAGWTGTAKCTSGEMALDQSAQVQAVTITDASISTNDIGANDQWFYGVNNNLAQVYYHALLANDLWLTIPTANLLTGSTITYTGTWTADALGGKSTTQNGATASGTVIGKTVYVVGVVQNSQTGTANISVDGNVVGTMTSAPPGGVTITTQNGATYGWWAVRIPNLTLGPHVVTVTTTNTGINYVDVIAGSGAQASATGPFLFHFNLIPQTSGFPQGGSQANLNYYNSLVQDVIQQLASDGLHAVLIDDSSPVQTAIQNALSGCMVNSLHPGNPCTALMGAAAYQQAQAIILPRDREGAAAMQFDGSGNPLFNGFMVAQAAAQGSNVTFQPAGATLPAPLFYYSCANGSGSTLSDITGNGNDGTFVGSTPYWNVGFHDGGCDFNGADNVNITTPGSLGAVQSTSMWVKFTGTSANQYLLQEGTGNNPIYIGTGANAGYAIGVCVSSATKSLADGSWHFIVRTFDGTYETLYIDGAFPGQYAKEGCSFSSLAGTLTLGVNSGGLNYFTGSMDEISMWNVALNSQQVQALYNAGAGFFYPFTPSFMDVENSAGTPLASIDYGGNATLNTLGVVNPPADGSSIACFDAGNQLSTGCSSGSTSWNAITNPTGNLTLSMAGYTSTFNATSSVVGGNWIYANTTAATSGGSQGFPGITLQGTFWNGTSSVADPWEITPLITTGATGYSRFRFQYTGSAGTYAVEVPTLQLDSVSAPGTPLTGQLYNASGILKFYDGTNTNSLTTIQAAPTSGHCVEFSGTAGILADTGSACAGNLNFPATVSGTTSSGGIPYFSNTTTLTSSSTLTQYGPLYGGGAGAAPGVVAPQTTNGTYVLVENVTASAAVAPTLVLQGVPVNNQTGSTYTLLYSDRASEIYTSGGSTFTLTLPAASGNIASNLPFVTYNGNSGNATVTPTTPNNINALTSQASLTILPKWADFFYQDSGSPINWHELGGGGIPTYAAFGSTCSNGLTWSTSSGIGCASSAPITSYPGAGIPISTGSAWGTSLAETDGDMVYGASGAWTKSPTPTLGASGTLGSLTLGNASSGLLTLEPTTGALGTVTMYVPVPVNSPGTLTQTVASGTSAMGTGAISSATCASVVTTTATGTATTDTVQASFNADPTSTTGYIPATSGMLTIISYPTSGNVNFKVCNNTSGSITPGAVTLNWRVSR